MSKVNYDKEAIAMMLNLAMKIETGMIPYDKVLLMLNKDKEVQKAVIKFWANFNDMTRNALNKLTKYTTCQIDILEYLEYCWSLN